MSYLESIDIDGDFGSEATMQKLRMADLTIEKGPVYRGDEDPIEALRKRLAAPVHHQVRPDGRSIPTENPALRHYSRRRAASGPALARTSIRRSPRQNLPARSFLSLLPRPLKARNRSQPDSSPNFFLDDDGSIY
jgi:hypothetical protein